MKLSSSSLVGHRYQSGVALIQVLLITTVISLLAISYSYTAREQVDVALAMERRANAKQLLSSAQDKLLYLLLTQNNGNQKDVVFPNSEPWNYYGDLFVLEQNDDYRIAANLQDISGLLPQPFVTWPFWNTLLSQLIQDEQAIDNFVGRFKDWQDKDTDAWILGDVEPRTLDSGFEYRNFPIQLNQEIALFLPENVTSDIPISQLSTIYPTNGFNIINAPEMLVRYLLPVDMARDFIDLRERGVINQQDVLLLLDGMYDETYLSFYPPTKFRMTLWVTFEDVEVTETLEVQVEPYKDKPLLYFSRY